MKTKYKTIIIVLVISLLGSIACMYLLKTKVPVFYNILKINKEFVYPVGHVVGIKADTDGALVIGYEENDVEFIGGLQIGDNIVKINGNNVSNIDDISFIMNELKQEKINVTFVRDGKYYTENIKVKNENGKYKLGVYVRVKVSGIGTISFYNKEKNKFYGIGHAITDVDTNTLLEIKKGEIYKPESFSIVKGSKNEVGCIKGEFKKQKLIGTFFNNTQRGISGNLTTNIYEDAPIMELGNKKDIKLGKAQIMFEDEKNIIRTYDINIDKILDFKNADKSMIISIIDKNLINYTGGVVRGMSGAPIVQNNKIIGAITYVFKDDHKKGYGIFIDEMLKLDKQ